MRQHQHTLLVRTHGKALHDLSGSVREVLAESRVLTGLATVFVAHTSASLLIQENADPEVQRDLERFFARLVPDGDPLFRHVDEGPDDMPAHVRSALTQTSIGIPVHEGRLVLGTWQGIYLYEHRDAPHQRKVVVHVLGE
jgi:secondary thiamine-phosphate synthase enzyme